MESPDVTFEPETGHWIDQAGKRWIRNISDEQNPVYVNIDQAVWILDQGDLRGRGQIYWDRIHLPVSMKAAFQHAVSLKLPRISSGGLRQYGVMLEKITTAYANGAISENFPFRYRTAGIVVEGNGSQRVTDPTSAASMRHYFITVRLKPISTFFVDLLLGKHALKCRPYGRFSNGIRRPGRLLLVNLKFSGKNSIDQKHLVRRLSGNISPRLPYGLSWPPSGELCK